MGGHETRLTCIIPSVANERNETMLNRLIFVVLLFGGPTALLAHHSVSAYFDTQTVVEAAGEVTSVSWRNPHARFELISESADGSKETWNIELTSLTNLRREGISGQLINVGDLIRVAGNPGRTDSSSLYAENLLLATGVEVILERRGEPRWPNRLLEHEGPSGPGDASSPELGIFRTWSSPRDQPLLLPEDTQPVFDFDLYPLTAAARASVEAFDRATDSPILNCVSKGMPTIMEQPYPMEFSRQGDDILLQLEEYDTERLIHMDPDATDDGQQHSKLGFSIGRWDGETLEVRTTRIDWAWFDVVGVPQSEGSELLERFTLSEDGSRLDYALIVTDPVNFTEPVTVTKFWVWYPEMTVEPYECRI